MSAHKILLVDDSRSARYALRMLLQKHDFEVDTADSAENALEKVKENPPDAIFMDHLMPGMNGFEALDALKADNETTHIPVVMCTSNDDEPYQIQAREKGALGILPKPATPEKLQSILKAIDDAMVPGGAAPTPTPATPPAAAPVAPAAPALDRSEIAAIVREELTSLMDSDIRPLISESVEARMQTVKDEVSETLLARSAQQINEWMDVEMTRVREEMSAGDGLDALSAKLDTDIGQVRDDLMKMETEHAQAVVHKIRDEVLPEMVERRMSQFEQQFGEQVDQRVNSMSDRLSREIPNNDQLIRRISETAETIAEHKAEEVARTHSREIAESTATEKASEVTDSLIGSAEKAVKSMYTLAGGAAAIGVLAAVLVFFLK